MKKYQVVKLKRGKQQYIADIVEANNEREAIQKYINRIISYWGFCCYVPSDFDAVAI